MSQDNKLDGGGRLPVWMLDLDNQMEEHIDPYRKYRINGYALHPGYVRYEFNEGSANSITEISCLCGRKIQIKPVPLPGKNRFPRWLGIFSGITACVLVWIVVTQLLWAWGGLK